jgi:hypothetical protein
LEAFRPEDNLRALDQQDPEIQEGMRITFKLLQGMKEICDQNGIQFVVVVIPTKNTVFAPYLEERHDLFLSDVLRRTIENENLARKKMVDFFKENNISYVDVLPAYGNPSTTNPTRAPRRTCTLVPMGIA